MPARIFWLAMLVASLTGALAYSLLIEHECHSVGQVVLGGGHYVCLPLTEREHK